MRALLAAAVMILTALAGCSTAPPAGDAPPSSADVAYQVPAAPRVAGEAIAALHAEFVTAFPDRSNNAPTHEAARQDILARFASYGLETYRMDYTNDIDQANILGIKWGIHRDRWVVVEGHFDTTCRGLVPACALETANPTQGAYDNGSGTALMLALAQAYANVTPYNTIVFVAMDGEERGTHGASAFVDEVTSGETPYGPVVMVGALDIDMLGLNWPGVNAPINVLANDEVARRLIDERAAMIGFPEGQIKHKDEFLLGSSDYVHFWRLDDPPVSTVFLISDFEEVGAPAPAPDQAHTPGPVGLYPFWHLQDTIETMRVMAGDPPAEGVAHPNLEAGFASAFALTSEIVHFMACEPDVVLDPVPRR